MVDPGTVNDLLGYESSSFRPQGLRRVSDDRPTAEVIRRFGIWGGISRRARSRGRVPRLLGAG